LLSSFDLLTFTNTTENKVDKIRFDNRRIFISNSAGEEKSHPLSGVSILQNVALIVLVSLYGYSCGQGLSGAPPAKANADTGACAQLMHHVKLRKADALHTVVEKTKIPKLITYLHTCQPEYSFADQYADRDFNLTVPGYLVRIYYEYSDQNYGITVRDEKNERSIQFSYDFDDSYRQFFVTHGGENLQKIDSLQLNGQIVHRFINSVGEHVGVVFSSNHLNIFYFTKSEKFEQELETAISKFNW
jgi:hypothetical protein